MIPRYGEVTLFRGDELAWDAWYDRGTTALPLFGEKKKNNIGMTGLLVGM